MLIALYCPDIAANAGACLRIGACFGIPVHIIEPAGFPVGDAGFRRAGMDYIHRVEWHRHPTFAAFDARRRAEERRLVLFTTSGAEPLPGFRFRADDALLFGRESAGVPEDVHALADARVRIPIRAQARSLNMAVSVGIAAAEALRQTGGFPA